MDAAYYASNLVGSFIGNKKPFSGSGLGRLQSSRSRIYQDERSDVPLQSLSYPSYDAPLPQSYRAAPLMQAPIMASPPSQYLLTSQPNALIIDPTRGAEGMGTHVEPAPTDEDISEEEKTLQKLPNAHRIEEIISKFRDFKFTGLLPAVLRYNMTEGDSALETNIKTLFAKGIIEEIFNLKDILLIIVSRQDKLMSEKQNKSIESKKKLSKSQQNGIKMFYPCLIALIDAALTRCDLDASQTSENFHATRTVLLLWKEIVSDLNEIFKVIIHGKNAEMFDLGDYPTSLLQIVNIKNKRIAAIKRMVGGEKKEILQLSQELNKGNQDIELVKSKYANTQSEKGLKNAELLGFEKALRAMTEVKQMVKINIGNITAMMEPS